MVASSGKMQHDQDAMWAVPLLYWLLKESESVEIQIAAAGEM